MATRTLETSLVMHNPCLFNIIVFVIANLLSAMPLLSFNRRTRGVQTAVRCPVRVACEAAEAPPERGGGLRQEAVRGQVGLDVLSGARPLERKTPDRDILRRREPRRLSKSWHGASCSLAPSGPLSASTPSTPLLPHRAPSALLPSCPLAPLPSWAPLSLSPCN